MTRWGMSDSTRSWAWAGPLLALFLMVSSVWVGGLDVISEPDGETAGAVLDTEGPMIAAASPWDSVNDHAIGGEHLVTGDWWEGKSDHAPSATDWDGDGIENANDSRPQMAWLPGERRAAAAECPPDVTLPCLSGPGTVLPDDPTWSTPGDTDSFGVEFVDVDRDGDRDMILVAAHSGRFDLDVYLNTRGQFNETPDHSDAIRCAKTWCHVTFADVDMDGWVDAVTGSTGTPNYAWYRNHQGRYNTTAEWSHNVANGSALAHPRVADINGDGYQDIVMGRTADAGRGAIEVFLGNAAGHNSSADLTVWTDKEIDAVDVGDLNGDGWLDVGAGSLSSLAGIAFNNAGSLNSTLDVSFTRSARSVAIVDHSGDGHPDFLTCRGGIHRYEGNGLGIDTTANWSVSTGGCEQMIVADLNGDGHMDLVNAGASRLQINLGHRDGPDVIPTWTYDGTRLWAAGVGDIDGDGDLDVGVSGGWGDVDHVFRLGGAIPEDTATWVASTGGHYLGPFVGDHTGDGILDIVSGRPARVYIGADDATLFDDDRIWEANGSGQTNHLSIGDVDGDGQMDMVRLVDKDELHVHIGPLYDDDDGSYTNDADQVLVLTNFTNGTQANLGDVDSDGDADVIVTSTDSCQRIFLSSSGSIDATPHWTGACGSSASSAHFTDLDDDGRPDLVIGTSDAADLIYTNTGGNFSQSTSAQLSVGVTSSGSPLFWRAGDVDLDGTVDLFRFSGTSFVGGHFGPFSGNHGAFDWTLVAPWAGHTFGGALADVDLDGDLDLIASPTSYRGRIYQNDGAGGFPDYAYISETKPDSRGLHAADINGDGAVEIIVGGFFSPVTVYRGVPDIDSDWVNDTVDAFPEDPTQGADADGDGYGDDSDGYKPDSCTSIAGLSWRDRWGCADEDEDGQSNLNDAFWQKASQWFDADQDGQGDNFATTTTGRLSHWPGEAVAGTMWKEDPSPLDFDDDGYEDQSLNASHDAQPPFDDCVTVAGTSWQDAYGCSDVDADGWSDEGDAFPADSTQWNNSDDDRYGDNASGNLPDQCPLVTGNSTFRVSQGALAPWYGCPDSDGDGVEDVTDFDANDSSAWMDADNDGWPDQSGAASSDDCPGLSGLSALDRLGCRDTDRDGYSDPDADWTELDGGDAFPFEPSQHADTDGDGYGDNGSGWYADACPLTYGSSQWNTNESGRYQHFGCVDSDRDGYADDGDDCVVLPGTSSWNGTYGCPDADDDGVADLSDDCLETEGSSWIVSVGCPDADGDGLADTEDPLPLSPAIDPVNDADEDGCLGTQDAFPFDAAECTDTDGDGVGDGADHFPKEVTQWRDTDGDGYGDNASIGAIWPDHCPTEWGHSNHSSGQGCPDADGDTVGDRWDDFPDDPTQTTDADGDGYGDNHDGVAPDACPLLVGASWRFDVLGCPDADRDGVADHRPSGTNGTDAFANDPTQWNDTDGDGFGDEALGRNPDACPDEAGNSTIVGELGCPDRDGDGIDDARDAWPDRADAWSDSDGDGYADQSGLEDSDDCPNQAGTSTRPWRGCADLDGDGEMDLTDPDADGDFIADDLERQASEISGEFYSTRSPSSVPLDTDGDRVPDILDIDDDDDTWSDEVELERGSDPLDWASTPITMYGDTPTGTFYVPGKGFQTSYSPDGIELSLSSMLELVTSEFLIPLLLLPATLYLMLNKRIRFVRTRRRVRHASQASEFEELDHHIDDLVRQGQLKAEHALLLRSLHERRREEARESGADVESILRQEEQVAAEQFAGLSGGHGGAMPQAPGGVQQREQQQEMWAPRAPEDPYARMAAGPGPQQSWGAPPQQGRSPHGTPDYHPGQDYRPGR